MTLLNEAIVVAESQVGVHEEGGRNRGSEVDEYIRSVGLDPTHNYPWCAAWVYWTFNEAAKKLSVPNPLPRTAGALSHWHWSRGEKLRYVQTSRGIYKLADQEQLIPGAVVVWDHGHGKGHIGIVTGIDFASRLIEVISGNTNSTGSREGDSVCRQVKPMWKPGCLGFIVYSSSSSSSSP